MRLFPALTVLLAGLHAADLKAQDAPAAKTAAKESIQPNEKAARYLSALRRRPAAGYLFDRFCDAWLDTHSLEELEAWLAKQASAPDAKMADHLLHAFYLQREGEDARAMEVLRDARSRWAADPILALETARAAMKSGDDALALQSVTAALALKPDEVTSREARQMEGKLLLHAGRTAEALQAWDSLLKSSPEDENLREDIIELQAAEGLTDAALATARALAQNTADPYKKLLRRLRVADLEERTGSREESLATLGGCLADSAAGSWIERQVLEQLSGLFTRSGEAEALLAHLTKLAEKEPARIALRLAAARTAADMGETERANQEWQAILRMTPGNRTLREEYLGMLEQTGRPGEALAAAEELVKQYPEDDALRLRMAALLKNAGRQDEAVTELRKVLDRSPGAEADWLRAAGELERLGLAKAAIALYREMLTRFPASEAGRESLAGALHGSEQRDEAVAEWKRMAEGADLNGLMRASRAAEARNETELAWQLLLPRAEDGAKNTVFLTLLCTLAERTGHSAEGLPHARRLAAAATSPSDLESAVLLVEKLAERAGQTEPLLKELKAAAAGLTVQELCLLAMLHERRGETAEAITALEAAETKEAELGALMQVQLRTVRGDFAGAATALKRVVERPGGRKPAHVQRLAELLKKAGDTPSALTWMTEWRRLAPGTPAPSLAAVSMLEDSGEQEEALRMLRQAASAFPDNDDVKMKLGSLCAQTGRWAETERIFTRLMEDAPNPGARLDAARRLTELARTNDRLPQVITLFEERCRADRQSPLPWMALAEAHRAAENEEEQSQALMTALRLKPEDTALLIETARLLSSESRNTEAISILREALPRDRTGRVRSELASILIEESESAEALQLLRESCAEAKDARAFEKLLNPLAQRRNWKEVSALLEPRLAEFRDDLNLNWLHAAACMETGKPDAACAVFLRALSGSLKALPKSASGVSTDWERQYRYLATSMSEEAALLIGEPQLERYIGAWRNNTWNPVSIPQTDDQTRLASLYWLHSLAGEIDESKTAGLAASMEAAGVKEAALLLKFPPGTGSDEPGLVLDLLREHPDSALLAGLLISGGINAPLKLADPAALRRVIEHLSAENSPLTLAGLAVLGISLERTERRAVLEQALAWLQAGKPAGELSMIYFGHAVEDKGLSLDLLTAEQRMAFATSFSAAYAALPVSVYRRGPAFWSLGQKANADQARSVAPWMETTAAKYRAEKKPRPPSPPSEPELPDAVPARLPGLPDELMQLIAGNSNTGWGRLNTANASPAFWKELAATLKDPLLRLMALTKARDFTAARELSDQLMKEQSPGFDAILLCAGHHASRGRLLEAAQVLQRADDLPLDRIRRQITDGALTALGRKLVETGQSRNTKELNACRQAALRFRTAPLTPDGETELAAVLRSLGAEPEADALEMRLTTGPALSAEAVTLRVQRLADAGDRAGAAQTLAIPLTKFLRGQLAQMRDGERPEIDSSWTDPVQEHALMPELEPHFLPAKDAPDSKWYSWAALCEVLGDTDKALKVWQDRAKAAPQDDTARIHAARLLSSEKRYKEMRAFLLQSPPARLGGAFDVLRSSGEMIENAAAASDLWDRRKPADPGTPSSRSGANDLSEILTGLIWPGDRESEGEDGVRPVPLLALDEAIPEKFLGTAERARRAEQIQLVKRVGTQLVDQPGISTVTFSHLARVASADPGEWPLDDLAARAFAAACRARPSSAGRGMPHFETLSSGMQRMPSPSEHFVIKAWREKKPETLEALIYQPLRAAGWQREAEWAKQYSELWFCPESEWTAKALAYANEGAKDDVPLAPQALLTVWRHRKLPAPLLAAVLQSLAAEEAKVKRSRYGDWIQMMTAECMEAMVQVPDGRPAVEQLIRWWIEKTLGPPASRPMNLSVSRRTTQWLEFWNAIANHGALLPVAGELAEKEIYPHAPEGPRRDFLINSVFGRISFQRWIVAETDKVLAALQAPELSGTVPQVQLWLTPGNPVSDFWRQQPDSFDDLPVWKRRLLKESLESRPQTFGRDLFLALLESDSQKVQRAMRQVALKNTAALKALPADQAAGWSHTLAQLAGTPVQPAEEKTPFAWLDRNRKPAATGDDPLALVNLSVEEILAKGDEFKSGVIINAFLHVPPDAAEQRTRLVRRLRVLQDEVRKAVSAGREVKTVHLLSWFARSLDAAADAASSPLETWTRFTTEAVTIPDLEKHGREVHRLLEWTLRTIDWPEGPPFSWRREISSDVQTALTGRLSALLHRRGDAGAACRELIDEVVSNHQTAAACLTLFPLLEAVETKIKRRSPQWAELIAWMEQQSAEGRKGELLRTAAAVFRAAPEAWLAAGQNGPERLSPLREAILPLLTNPAVSPTVRLSLAEEVVSTCDLDAPLADGVLSVLTSFSENGRALYLAGSAGSLADELAGLPRTPERDAAIRAWLEKVWICWPAEDKQDADPQYGPSSRNGFKNSMSGSDERGIFRLALRFDPDKAKTLLASRTPDAGWLAEMIREGADDMALGVLRSRGAELPLNTSSARGDTALDEKARAFLEKIPDPGMRWMADIVLWSLPRPESPVQGRDPAQTAALTSLLQRTPEDRKLQDVAIAIAQEEEPAVLMACERLAGIRLPLVKTLESGSATAQGALQACQLAVRHQLAAGKFAEASALLQRIIADDEGLWYSAGMTWLKAGFSLSPDKYPACGQAWRDLLAGMKATPENDQLSSLYGSMLCWHAHAGLLPELTAWRKNLKADRRKEIDAVVSASSYGTLYYHVYYFIGGDGTRTITPAALGKTLLAVVRAGTDVLPEDTSLENPAGWIPDEGMASPAECFEALLASNFPEGRKLTAAVVLARTWPRPLEEVTGWVDRAVAVLTPADKQFYLNARLSRLTGLRHAKDAARTAAFIAETALQLKDNESLRDEWSAQSELPDEESSAAARPDEDQPLFPVSSEPEEEEEKDDSTPDEWRGIYPPAAF